MCGQNRRGAVGRDRDRDVPTQDECTEGERAQLGFVGHVDWHTERSSDRCNAGILCMFTARRDDEWSAADVVLRGRLAQQLNGARLDRRNERRRWL